MTVEIRTGVTFVPDSMEEHLPFDLALELIQVLFKQQVELEKQRPKTYLHVPELPHFDEKESEIVFTVEYGVNNGFRVVSDSTLLTFIGKAFMDNCISAVESIGKHVEGLTAYRSRSSQLDVREESLSAISSFMADRHAYWWTTVYGLRTPPWFTVLLARSYENHHNSLTRQAGVG